MLKVYEVLKEFDLKKDYGLDIRRQYGDCLSVMKKGDKFNSKDFIQEHLNEFTQRRHTIEANKQVFQKAISIGKKIGVIREILDESIPISYPDFCKLETVSYFRSQTRGSNRKNLKPKTDGTRDTYTRHLHYFNNWIYGKTLEYTTQIQVDTDTFKKKLKKVKLKGLEHFLKIYSEGYFDKKPFFKLIKSYFLEPKIKSMGRQTKNIKLFAIKEYFKKNDEPIDLNYDPNSGVSPDNDLEQIMSLEEFLKILSVGNPSLTEKAVFLCKFQRGLDSSTLVDRFNFEAWSQIIDAFGTEDYKKWDRKKCPILIELSRVKTNISHFGFLDRDSIDALVDYLQERKRITGKEMSEKSPLFLNSFQKPISETWISQNFARMRKKAGLDEILNKNRAEKGGKKKYRITPHETRDLLKSVLLESGVRPDLAEEFIGHKTRDSYEKQMKLFTSTLRKEYAKASGRLNVFSKFQEFSKGAGTDEEMEKRFKEMELKMQKMFKRISRTDKLRRVR